MDCKICGQKGQGTHFGVVSCRACAAFFRRAADSKWTNMECLSRHCDGKTYHCKPCRLKRCREVGMDTSKFQHERDLIQTVVSHTRKRKIPDSFEYFIGRPNFVLFYLRGPSEPKTFVDLNILVSQAKIILKLGAESPLIATSQLEKLNYGLNCMNRNENPKKIHHITQKEVSSFWEYHLLATAKWLTHFDKFQELEKDLKLKILFAVWHVWGRLDKLMATALYRKNNKNAKKSERVVGNGILTDMFDGTGDASWMSKLPVEQVAYFLNGIRAWDLFHLIDELQTSEITEMEMTFMLAQISFQYAASRFGGKIAELMDEFQLILSNDLHTYYVEQRNMPRYSARLMKLLNINRQILENIRKHRSRADIANVFNVFCLEFSHPDMFKDTGFVVCN